eukprot:TRINITY_DN3768_c0_g2_i1.p1 TRINITY_DN3768_c0_g2~~TRINITY_DN3768_c0_g2_i1.p1  ORF type:complete len:945 (+),score=190.42 TRINITY_DN3768_c0_g2_i1:68-2902(+)
MVVTLQLRPTLAVGCLITTAVSLAGGLTLYGQSLSAVRDTVSRGRTVVDHALNQSLDALGVTVRKARETLVQVVDHGSDADVRLFASRLRVSFTTVEEAVRAVIPRAKVIAKFAPSLEHWNNVTDHMLCEEVLGDLEQRRLVGLGVGLYQGIPQRVADSFCWIDWSINDYHGVYWQATRGAHWGGEDGHHLITPWWNIRKHTWEIAEPEPFSGAERPWPPPAELTTEYWLRTRSISGRWAPPLTWATAQNQTIIYLSYGRAFLLDDLPAGHPLHGMLGRAAGEGGLGNWQRMMQNFTKNQGEGGMMAVVDFRHHLLLAHTTEPWPVMAADPRCQNYQSTEVGGLINTSGSACFPLIYNYSITNQFAHATLWHASYDELVEARMCTCGGSLADCDASCAESLTRQDFFMRKHHLYTLADYVLDVLWYRDVAEVSDEVSQQEAAARQQAGALQESANTLSEESQADAENVIEQSLYVMIASVVASFLINAAVAIMWIALLAVPLDVLMNSVRLMGEVRTEDAVAVWESRRPCLEVQEIQRVGAGLTVASKVLAEYRSFLPVAFFVEQEEDTEGQESEEAQRSTPEPPANRKVSVHSAFGSGANSRNPSVFAASSSQGSDGNPVEGCVVPFAGVQHDRSRSPSNMSPTTQSHTSEERGGSRGRVFTPRRGTGLVSALGAKTKRMSLLFLNVVDFHPYWHLHGGKDALDFLTEVAGTALGLALQLRGVLHQQCGDRVCFTFGGVQDLIGQSSKAALAAMRIAESQQDTPRVAVGVATGRCSFGVVSAGGARTLTVVGPVVTRAHACCRACKAVSARAVVDRTTYEDTKAMITYRCAAIWSAHKLGGPTPLFQAMEEHQEEAGAAEEWMYNLAAREESNPYTRFNDLVLRRCAALRRNDEGGVSDIIPDLEKIAREALASPAVPENDLAGLYAVAAGPPVTQVSVDLAV